MILLILVTSFVMFSVVLLIGIAIGYGLGYKNDRTLKQQISNLKGTVRKQNQSRQLTELTTAELKQREDWDFRSKLAELTGNPVTNVGIADNPDPQSMDKVF